MAEVVVRVVYNSFAGRYSDSPRAVYEALATRPGVEHLWLADQRHEHGFPAGVGTVPVCSEASRAALERADVVVSNTHIEQDWSKAPGATYLQTWHGTPLKRIHHDALWAPPGRLAWLSEDVARWDALLSPNQASTPWLRGAFRFTGEVLESGYPRNDVLRSPARHRIRASVRTALGIPEGTTVVLYAPTWRDHHEEGTAFVPQLDPERFSRRLGRDHVLLLRLHYFDSGRLAGVDVPGVHDVSFHPDISDLYLASDVLVTDYSSTMFDFAITGKPILFYCYDLDHYRDTLRGFYFDHFDDAPGPLLHAEEEVLDALTSLPEVARRYEAAYGRFCERFCHLEDGGATRRVLDRFFPTDPGAPIPTPSMEVAR